MEKKFKIDFWQVNNEGGVEAFSNALRTLSSLPEEGGDRNLNDGGSNTIRLQFLSHRRDRWEGDFHKIRIGVLPIRQKINGNVSPLILDDDEGLGEETAFIYYPERNILVTQRDRYAVTKTGISKYLIEKTELVGFELLPILRRDAMERLSRLTTMSSMELKFASIDPAASIPAASDLAFADMLKFSSEMESPSVTLQLSMGRARSGSLNIRALRAKLNELLGCRNDYPAVVQQLKVKGCDDEGITDAIDLVQERIVAEASVELDEHRHPLRERRFYALRNAWEENKDAMEHIAVGA